MQDALTSRASELRAELDALLAAPVLGDPGDLTRPVTAALRVREAAEGLVAAAVRQARADGVPWQAIGDALGVTRQAAFQRYGRPIDPRTGEAMNTTPLPEAGELAAAVIDELAASDWGAVAERFDQTMAARLSADGLAAAWAQLASQAGRYESHGAPETVRAADLTVTTTRLAFEAGDFVARISFRDDRSVAGLFILNPDAA